MSHLGLEARRRESRSGLFFSGWLKTTDGFRRAIEEGSIAIKLFRKKEKGTVPLTFLLRRGEDPYSLSKTERIRVFSPQISRE